MLRTFFGHSISRLRQGKNAPLQPRLIPTVPSGPTSDLPPFYKSPSVPFTHSPLSSHDTLSIAAIFRLNSKQQGPSKADENAITLPHVEPTNPNLFSSTPLVPLKSTPLPPSGPILVPTPIRLPPSPSPYTSRIVNRHHDVPSPPPRRHHYSRYLSSPADLSFLPPSSP